MSFQIEKCYVKGIAALQTGAGAFIYGISARLQITEEDSQRGDRCCKGHRKQHRIGRHREREKAKITLLGHMSVTLTGMACHLPCPAYDLSQGKGIQHGSFFIPIHPHLFSHFSKTMCQGLCAVP